jgi:uncharacterized protein YndB with AHSA1/START domain
METPECEMDLRPGGIFRARMHFQGTDYPMIGVFLEVVPNERVVSTDAFLPGWLPSEKAFMVSTTTFEDMGGGRTLYTARAWHWSDEDLKGHEAMGFHDGWGQSADRFKALVERS